MANITIGLSMSSSNVLSTPLALAESFSASVDSGSLIRAKVKGTAADTNDMIVYLANDKNDRAYLYIQNLASELENYIYVRNETESDCALTAKIGGGEFAFLPMVADDTLKAYATTTGTIVEWMVFGTDQ